MIIGLSGFARVGKDEVAKIFVEEFDYTQLSFATSLKQAVYNLNPLVQDNRRVQDIVDQFGWDIAKDSFPEIRKLLQRMGTEVARKLWGDNFWIKIVDRFMFETLTDVDFHVDDIKIVFSDARFENEALFIRNSGGIIVRVNRPGVGPVNAHDSDAGLPDELVDYDLDNDGSLKDLRFKVIELLRTL